MAFAFRVEGSSSSTDTDMTRVIMGRQSGADIACFGTFNDQDERGGAAFWGGRGC